MSDSWQGLAAIVTFFLLLLFFFAAVAIAPGFVAAPASSANTTVTNLTAPVGNNSLVAGPVSQPPVVTTNGQPGSTTYIIQPGDWLSNIARQYNTTVPAILAANPQITDPDNVSPGQSILIPSVTP